MATKMKLPIGIENFKEIRKEGFYIGRMDMLKCFFEYGCDAGLFEGLSIDRERECCREYMGSFPVVSVSLKGVGGADYGMALGMLRFTISDEALRFQFLLDSDRLSQREKERYGQLINVDTSGRHGFLMQEAVPGAPEGRQPDRDGERLMCPRSVSV